MLTKVFERPFSNYSMKIMFKNKFQMVSESENVEII